LLRFAYLLFVSPSPNSGSEFNKEFKSKLKLLKMLLRLPTKKVTYIIPLAGEKVREKFIINPQNIFINATNENRKAFITLMQ